MLLPPHMTWNMQTELAALSGAFDFIALGVLVVDAGLSIVWKNDAGRRILEANDGLCAVEGRLKASTPSGRRRLAEIVARLRESGAALGCSGGIIPRPSGWLGYQVMVKTTDTTAPIPPCATIFVADPARDLDEVEPCLMQMYALTASEAAVAGAVARGMDLNQIGKHRGASRGTVRVQLRQVFEKVGVRRQVDLVRLVLGIAATRCTLTERDAELTRSSPGGLGAG